MSASQFVSHTTYAGERWDLLAWRYYGDATAYGYIIMANPGVPIEPVFEAGIVLAIPIIQQQNLLTTDLPPWKTISSPRA
ncbi:MAG TPA: tail protein X [Candidatus Binataceae bacterium]|nr:tail protein X [Candidatus Binataceae bacterium]